MEHMLVMQTPNIGITAKDKETDKNIMCVNKELLYPGETLSEDYAKHKRLILEGVVDARKESIYASRKEIHGLLELGDCAFE